MDSRIIDAKFTVVSERRAPVAQVPPWSFWRDDAPQLADIVLRVVVGAIVIGWFRAAHWLG